MYEQEGHGAAVGNQNSIKHIRDRNVVTRSDHGRVRPGDGAANDVKIHPASEDPVAFDRLELVPETSRAVEAVKLRRQIRKIVYLEDRAFVEPVRGRRGVLRTLAVAVPVTSADVIRGNMASIISLVVIFAVCHRPAGLPVHPVGLKPAPAVDGVPIVLGGVPGHPSRDAIGRVMLGDVGAADQDRPADRLASLEMLGFEAGRILAPNSVRLHHKFELKIIGLHVACGSPGPGRLPGESGEGPMGRKFRLLAAVLLGSFSSTPALAWGDDGHRVIALIARHIIDQQDPQVGDRIDALLAGATDPPSAAAFDSKATWADDYRESSPARKAATRQWHFIDLLIGNPDRKLACSGNLPLAAGTPASRGPADDCVVRKINQFRRELRDPSVAAAEKKLALLYLLHFVGDLHQPLHSADNHDAGGNSVSVVVGNAEVGTNLHSYWDTRTVRRLGSTPQGIAALLIADLPQAVGPGVVSAASDERTYAWAEEAHSVAREHAYGGLPKMKRNCTIRPYGKPARTEKCVVLSSKYATAATGKARLQLQRGGARLAAVLIEALK